MNRVAEAMLRVPVKIKNSYAIMILVSHAISKRRRIQMDNKSVAHTRWNCTYHIVFIPKFRRKVMYGETRSRRDNKKVMRDEKC